MKFRALIVIAFLAAFLARSGDVAQAGYGGGYGTNGLARHATSHGSGGTDPVTLAQSQVTGLVSALAGKLPTTVHPGYLRFGSKDCATSGAFLEGSAGSDPCAVTGVETRQRTPFAGTISGLDCEAETAAGAAKAHTFTVYVDGSSTSVVATASDPATEARDVAHTAAVSAGSRVEVKVTYDGAAPDSVTCVVYLK